VPGSWSGAPVNSRSSTLWIEDGPPGNANVGGDRHMLIVDRDNRHLYGVFALAWDGTQWMAGSGAFFDLNSNARRPDGRTSADAAELAIQLEAHLEETDRVRRQQLERAHYEVERARRRDMQVDPTNRQIAATLEATWNENLQSLEDLRGRVERARGGSAPRSTRPPRNASAHWRPAFPPCGTTRRLQIENASA